MSQDILKRFRHLESLYDGRLIKEMCVVEVKEAKGRGRVERKLTELVKKLLNGET